MRCSRGIFALLVAQRYLKDHIHIGNNIIVREFRNDIKFKLKDKKVIIFLENYETTTYVRDDAIWRNEKDGRR